MNDEVGSAILLLVGGVVLRLGLTDARLAYVKGSMGLPLALAGGVLAALGAAALLRRRPAPAGPGPGHEHGRPRVAWLLLLPVATLTLVAPVPLGAFAADRQPAATISPPGGTFDRLPPAQSGPVSMSLVEFVRRVVYDPNRSLAGRPVRLVGFATADRRGGGFFLNRFVVRCCAADARPVRIAIRTTLPAPAPGDWVAVTGTWRVEALGPEDDEPPELEPEDVRPVAAPADQYEH